MYANDPKRTFVGPARFLAARQRRSTEAAGTDRGNMAMIGAAAASDQLQIGQRRQEFRVVLGELGHVADIDLRGGIELGVTLGRGIGPQAADAADPRRSALHLATEVTRMGAIDHVIGRIAAGTSAIATSSGLRPGRAPSVSTAKERTVGSPARSAARAMPMASGVLVRV